MKRIFYLLSILILTPIAASAQDYLQIVSLESFSGMNATFLSAGQAENKRDLKANAIQSLWGCVKMMAQPFFWF